MYLTFPNFSNTWDSLRLMNKSINIFSHEFLFLNHLKGRHPWRNFKDSNVKNWIKSVAFRACTRVLSSAARTQWIGKEGNAFYGGKNETAKLSNWRMRRKTSILMDNTLVPCHRFAKWRDVSLQYVLVRKKDTSTCHENYDWDDRSFICLWGKSKYLVHVRTKFGL